MYRIEVSVPLLYRVEKYQGTGWAWADKYLWTCKHLIPSAKNLHIEVWDASGTCHEARVVWRDSIADVALLVMDTMHASVGISLRDESFPKVGESVFSLGAPLGLLGTFQEGFVASEPRILDEKKSQPRQLLLQLSIPAQIGSSGSPVVDSQGNLIGMISDIATLSGGYEGICFAIPAQVLSQVWEKYRKFAANDTERPRPSY
ncbi:MAG: S1C family serine protease [Bacteroidia bacterium]|nr:S1C family serine protease [Bacteroidia bacterium]